MKWISNQTPTTKKIFTLLGICTSLTLSSCAPSNSSPTGTWTDSPDASAQVIYGSDGRFDLYQVADPNLKKWADSTVALIKNSDLQISGASTLIQGENFGTQMNLCSTEKFREQDTAAFCSGSLVGEDLILTAGHCIQNQSDCQSTALVFGFAVKSASVLPRSVGNNEVYHCQEIIRTQMAANGADFALIRLDRKVQGHDILQLHRGSEVETNASLVVIGHPVGLPTKITTGGSVRSVAGAGYFQANLDTYGGNSGSAVFNAATGLIEGVLVRGEQDFVSSGRCSVSKVCAEGSCRGEDVTRISQVLPYIPNTPQPPIPPTPPEPPQKPRVFSSNVVLKIPDNNKAGINSSITVSDLPQQSPVIVHVNIQHPFIGDLVIKLTAPNGRSIMLQQRSGGSTHDLSQNYDVTLPLDFNSHPQAGSYTLSVQDLAARDIGSLLSWSIQFGL